MAELASDSGPDRPDRDDALATTVRTLREGAGMTQIELAELVGVGPRVVGELERGKPTIRMDVANRVLGAFGLQLGAVERVRRDET